MHARNTSTYNIIFIREAVEDGKITVKYIPTDENVSDIFTKALPKPKFQRLVELLGLREAGIQSRH